MDAGREQLTASRDLHHELGIRIGEGRALSVLGMSYVMAGEVDRAKELIESALELFVAEADQWGQGACHMWLGMIVESSASDPAFATDHYRKAVDFLRPSRDASLLPVALIGQAGVIARRRPEDALKVAAAAVALRARVGGVFPPFYRERLDRARVAAEAGVGPDADRVWSEGSRLPVDQAVALAFGDSTPRPASPSGLSRRELEVAELVADGLANKAIAQRLPVRPDRETHVRHADQAGARQPARSSPPGRATAFSSESAIALKIRHGPEPTLPPSPRLRRKATKGAGDGVLPDLRAPRSTPEKMEQVMAHVRTTGPGSARGRTADGGGSRRRECA